MKTKTRSIHELLIVMRDNFDEYYEWGLCVLANNLYAYDIYSYKELCILMRYINENRPNQERGWSWTIGEKEPRKKWLDEQIKLTNPK